MIGSCARASTRIGGSVIKTTGDGMLAVFADAVAAIDAAVAAQRPCAMRPGTRSARCGFGWRSTPVPPRRATGTTSVPPSIAWRGSLPSPTAARSSAPRSLPCSPAMRLPASVDLVDLGSHRLRDIDRPEQIYQVVVGDLDRGFPPLRSLSTRRSNLPVQLTSFVGREKELGEVATLIERHRLVTLIGTGGTGKTRLMLEAAGRLIDRYADGVWLAELAPLGDPSQIPSEVARALGAPEVPGVPATGDGHRVRRRQGPAAPARQRGAPRRRRGRVCRTAARERARPAHPDHQSRGARRSGRGGPPAAVPVLPRRGGSPIGRRRRTAVADCRRRSLVGGCPAVHGAGRVGRSGIHAWRFQRCRRSCEICQRLDGIPLAIELAAARVSAMSPDDIARRLGDRFRLLAGGRRTAVPRQQTLHAIIDWSWDLLTDEDRRLLRRLSVFSGGWTVPMAARIVGDDSDGMDPLDLEDGLTRLIDRSLVLVDRDTMRYRMLETIRQYAREQLIAAGEAPAVADRHLAVYAALAIESEAPMRGPSDRRLARPPRCRAGQPRDAPSSGASRPNHGPRSGWRRPCSPTGPSASCPRTTTPDRRGDRDRPGSRSSAGPTPAPADQALAARLLGEAARLWGMSGRATVALGWAQDAVRLAEASGDAVGTSGRARGPRDRARVLRPGGPGWVWTCGRSSRRRADLAEEIGEWWLLAPGGGLCGGQPWTFDAGRRSGAHASRRRRGATVRSPYAIGVSVDGAGPHARPPGEDRRRGRRLRRRDPAVHRDRRRTVRPRVPQRHGPRPPAWRAAREAMALYRETIGGWVRLGHKGAIAEPAREHRVRPRLPAKRTSRPSACSARPTRSARLPMPAWHSTRSPSTTRRRTASAMR